MCVCPWRHDLTSLPISAPPALQLKRRAFRRPAKTKLVALALEYINCITKLDFVNEQMSTLADSLIQRKRAGASSMAGLGGGDRARAVETARELAVLKADLSDRKSRRFFIQRRRCNDFDISLTHLSSFLRARVPTPSPRCGVAWSISRCSAFRADWRSFGCVVSKLALQD